jgi:hypothetical protein
MLFFIFFPYPSLPFFLLAAEWMNASAWMCSRALEYRTYMQKVMLALKWALINLQRI